MGLFDQVICRNNEYSLEMAKRQHSNLHDTHWDYADSKDDICRVLAYNDSINNCTYSAVLYKPGCISIVKALSIDVISYDFSGCYMASFKAGTERFVAHIAYGDMWGYQAAKKWNELINNKIIRDVRIFNPAHSMDRARGIYNQVWGIISSKEEFYALSVYVDFGTTMVDANGIFQEHPIVDKYRMLEIKN